MTEPLQILRGDTKAATITLTDNGAPVNLTAATLVRFVGEGAATINETTDQRPANGVLTRAWAASEVDNAGAIRMRVIVTWPTGEIQSFPGPPAVLLAMIQTNITGA